MLGLVWITHTQICAVRPTRAKVCIDVSATFATSLADKIASNWVNEPSVKITQTNQAFELEFEFEPHLVITH